MNRRLLSSICTTALCLALFPAARSYAEANPFYVQGDIGGAISSDVHLKEFLGQALAPNTQITLDPGARFAIRGGYGLTDWLAAEVETGMLANDIETITTTGVLESNGSILNVPLLFNLRLQVPEKYRLAPYVGAGFGFTSTILTGNELIIGARRFEGAEADVVFAYQFFAGVRFALNDRMGLSAEYHYFHAEESNFSMDTPSGVGTDEIKLGRTETHSFTIAFDWRF
jgi:opacity protein-like surface antigen